MTEEYGEQTNKRQRLNSESQINIDNYRNGIEIESEKSPKEGRTSPGSMGYLRLAVVLGMMCCSSFVDNSQSAGQSDVISNQQIHSIVSSSTTDDIDLNKKLYQMNIEPRDQLLQSAKLMKSIKNPATQNLLRASQGPVSGIFKTLMDGKFQYLSNAIANKACSAFWLTPNQHKLRLIRPRKSETIITKSTESPMEI